MNIESASGLPDMRNPVHLLAFGFGSGLLPKAPGTFGTLVGIPFYLLLQPLPLLYYATVVGLAFVFGIWLCDQTSRDLGVHDHSGIVWDEIVGYLVTMTVAPGNWVWLLTGFLLFRLFDIFKPWPIRWIDKRVEGGFGIMLDDLIAGLFAAGCLLVLNRWEWF
jgi:phosphatidylglycerophosphatase A